jgi:hypothetical protein
MARKRKQKMDLATAFQAVSDNLVKNQSSLNQADDYNHNHGNNMVEIFGVINEAIEAKRDRKPAEQLAFASELLEQRSQSGSAKIYAGGLAQASKQFKGKAITPDNLTTLLGSLLGGQAPAQPSPDAAPDPMGSLLAGAAGGQGSGAQTAGIPADLLGSMLSGATGGDPGQPGSNATADLLGSLLGGAAGGQGSASQPSSTPGDLIGSLLGGGTGGQPTSSQPGLDMGDLLNAGMAFMNSQQQGEGKAESLIKAFVAATQAGQKPHHAQSGEVVANTLIQLLGKQSRR